MDRSWRKAAVPWYAAVTYGLTWKNQKQVQQVLPRRATAVVMTCFRAATIDFIDRLGTVNGRSLHSFSDRLIRRPMARFPFGSGSVVPHKLTALSRTRVGYMGGDERIFRSNVAIRRPLLRLSPRIASKILRFNP
jgi:hypothetical protein